MDDFTFELRIPLNLKKDMEAFIASLPQEKKRYSDHYYYVCSTVTLGLIDEFFDAAIRNQHISFNRWHCHLYSTNLHSVLGNLYNMFVTDLIDAGIIVRGTHYVPTHIDEKTGDEIRGESKPFWLKHKYSRYLFNYLASKVKKVEDGVTKVSGAIHTVHVTNKFLLKRIAYAKLEQHKKDLEDTTVRDCEENLTHFKIDQEMAEQVMDQLQSDGKMDDRKRELETKKVERFCSYGKNPMAIYVKKDRYGRIHTNITNLKKEIRESCMTCDGQAVGGVDITSSQASFLSKVFNEWVLMSEDVIGNYVPQTKFVPISYTNFTLEDQIRLGFEYDKYNTMLKTGKLYEHFAIEIGRLPSVNRVVTRDEAKKAFLSMLYDRLHINRKKHPLRGYAKDVFTSTFPMLQRCIISMKSNGYARLAYEMQRIESEFIFGRVIPRIQNEIGCPYCTVHDSVIVPLCHIDQVKAIMDEELEVMEIPTLTKKEYAKLTINPLAESRRKRVEREMETAELVAEYGYVLPQENVG